MEIRFNILEEQLKELKHTSVKEFDDFANIEGQFEFVIGNIKFGYVDNEIPFSNELLISWFKILNKVLEELIENSNYVIFYIPDSYKWLELEVKGDSISITELKLTEKNVEFLITNKRYSNLFKYSTKVDVIGKKEFFNCILKNTDKFINNVLDINENLICSTTMQELIELYSKVNR